MRSRRSILQVSALAAALGAAGCSAAPWSGRGDPTDPGSDDAETPEPTDDDPKEVDDWQYRQPVRREDAARGAQYSKAQATAGGGAGGGGNVGLAAGGAKDVNNYRQNVEEGYLPLPTDISYEGLFYDYYFENGSAGSCSKLFCPTYTPAVTADPLSGETERYLTVGLNSGMSASDFERKKLNLVVVLDNSGSMSSGFGEYYYDQAGNKKEVENPDQPKMRVATEAIADMTRQLRPEDRFGMVVFNSNAQVAKPLREVEATDMAAIRGHLPEVKANGGTRMSAGIDEATQMLSEYGSNPQEYETRMVVLTDAMPNLGETSEEGLRAKLERNARNNLHTTFVGVGVDFNTKIIDGITSVRGANYYSVHSPKQFEKRLADNFKYMVTPLVFDLSVELAGEGFELQKVYGTTAAEESTNQVLYANTLFPSPTSEGKTKGGVILAKIRRTGSGEVILTASWEDRSGKRARTATSVQFPDGGPEQFGNSGVRKAVLLSRYADLMKSWAIDMRERDGQPRSEGVRVPREDDLGKWERQSTPLQVSTEYRQRFEEFAAYFEREMEALGDDALKQELQILEKLASLGGSRVTGPPIGR